MAVAMTQTCVSMPHKMTVSMLLEDVVKIDSVLGTTLSMLLEDVVSALGTTVSVLLEDVV